MAKTYFGAGGVKTVKKIYFGAGGVKKIKKGWIGIGSVPKLFFSAEANYYGTVPTSTSIPVKTSHVGGETASYAIFAGGRDNGSDTNTVYAYNSSFTATQCTNLHSYYFVQSKSFTINGYAVFCSGYNGVAGYNYAAAYDNSLTMKQLSGGNSGYVACAVIGNYGLLAGGNTSWQSSTTGTSSVFSYNSSLTRSSITSLAKARWMAFGGANNSYAIFAGGYTSSGGSLKTLATGNSYNSSLTRGDIADISVARTAGQCVSVGSYLLLASNNSSSLVVDTYDNSLTRGTAANLSSASNGYSETNGSYALIGKSSTTDGNIEVYDESLTKLNNITLTTPRSTAKSAKVGEYMLINGGKNADGDYCTDLEVISL